MRMGNFVVLAALFVGFLGFSNVRAAEEGASANSNTKNTNAAIASPGGAKNATKNLHLTGAEATSETYVIEMAKDGSQGTVTVTATTAQHPAMDSKVEFKVDSVGKNPDGTMTYKVKFADNKTMTVRADKGGILGFVEETSAADVVPLPVTK